MPPPPPPPPTGLIAPPGYAGYTASPFGSVALKRVKGLSVAATVLVAASALLPVASILARNAIVGDAEQYLAGSTTSTDFTEAIISWLLIGMLVGVATLAAAVLTMIWMFRVAGNHRTLHRGGTWGPGWGIGAWFAPPLLYVIPTLMLNELWKASDPSVPVGGAWRQSKRSPLPFVWFVLYSIVPLIVTATQTGDLFSQFGGSETALAEQIIADQTDTYVTTAVGIASAAVFVVLVRQITDRHRRLTGEATR
jgi:hypothetical protein